MLVGEFTRNPSGNMRSVAVTGEHITVEHYRKPYTAIVPHEWYKRAAAALAREEASATQEANMT